MADDLELDPFALYGLGAELDLSGDRCESPEIDPECVAMRNRLKSMILGSTDYAPSQRRRSRSFSESTFDFDRDEENEEVIEREIDTMSVREDEESSPVIDRRQQQVRPKSVPKQVPKNSLNPPSRAEKVQQSLGSVSEVFLQVFQALLMLLQHQNPIAQQ